MIPALLLAVPLLGVIGNLALPGRSRLRGRLILLVALVSLGLAIAQERTGALTLAVGGWAPPHGIELAADALSRLMLLLNGLIFTAAALELESERHERPMLATLPYALLLFALNGLFLTADAFDFYVFFELVAVSSYLLVTQGQDHPLEAAWKYSAQSAVGSLCLLTGVAFAYGMTGTLHMHDMAMRLPGPLTWAAPFVLLSFLLKSALFPFHLWQPDAYAAATTPGSAILGGILSCVGLYGLLRLGPLFLSPALHLLLQVLGAASILYGGIAAWREQDAKRLLASSSTSQLGFVLLALGWGSVAALAAAILYLVAHALGKALLFLVIGRLSDEAGSTRLADLRGRGQGRIGLQIMGLLGGLSLIGLPPSAGFLAKIALLRAGIELGAWPWVTVAVAGTLMTLGYVIRLYQVVFLPETGAPAPRAIAKSGMAALAIVLVGLGIAGAPWYEACQRAALELRP